MQLTSAQERELRKLVASGARIAAVKRCREITGLGLKEALEIVNRLAFGHPGHDDPPGPGSARAIGPAAAPHPDVIRKAEAAALAALREGHVLDAVKRYRQHTRLGLKESKDAVDILGLVHRSDGRVNSKLASLIFEKMSAGLKEEAITQMKAGAGYDDDEARKFIATLGRMGAARKGCGPGCAVMIAALLALLGGIAVWFAGQG